MNGEYEYADERFASPKDAAAYWRDALSRAEKEEANWRKSADNAVKVYEQSAKSGSEGPSAFNILHSNTEVITTAAYNATPIPDIRSRFLDKDELARAVGSLIERAISYQLDQENFDQTVEDAVRCALVPGRGVARVRYVPYLAEADAQTGEQVVYEEAPCEVVDWRDFRRGPAKTWDKCPWVAFRNRLTKAEIEKLAEGPEVDGTDLMAPEMTRGKRIADAVSYTGASDTKADEKERSPVKQAEVWEIWDKDARLIWWIADGIEEPVSVQRDEYQFPDFWPIPEPMVPVRTLGSLTPLVPYEFYRKQAEELERTSERIRKLTESLKYRGIRASEIEALDQVANLDDGEFAPSVDAMVILQQSTGGLDRAIWTWPIDKIIQVVRELVAIRETQKATIYEITGIADILRGSTDAAETLGAQQIKAQWGSLRIQRIQRMVQRFCRDLFRLKAHLIGNHFTEQTLAVLNGGPVHPEVGQALRSDMLRRMRVDIETDSTVRGDIGRLQQEQSNFLAAVGQYAMAVGPMVATPNNPAGVIPPALAVTVFGAFARTFKLGREVEDALAQIGQLAQQMKPPAPSPEEQAMKQAEARRMQAAAAKEEASAAREAQGLMRDQVDTEAAAIEADQMARGGITEGFVQ